MKFLLMVKCWILSLKTELFNSRKKSQLVIYADDTIIHTQEEPVILSKKSSRGNTVQQHIIFSTAPHIQSLAAGLLLRNELMLQDVNYLNSDFLSWLEFREQYLKKQLELHGALICAYCGKPHLEIGGRTPKDLFLNNKNPNLATIDHITALANGGEKYNEKNLCVSCKKCNRKKGTKSVEKFMKNKNVKKL